MTNFYLFIEIAWHYNITNMFYDWSFVVETKSIVKICKEISLCLTTV